MSYYIEKLITPDDLLNKTIFDTTIIIEKSNKVLLTGTIYNSLCESIEGAVVQIFEINAEHQRNNLGYVITNQFGEFAITVIKNINVKYQLDVYEPLITRDKDDQYGADT